MKIIVQLCIIVIHWCILNLFPHTYPIWPLCSRRLLKTLWQKVKLLIMSNFTFCRNVFKSRLQQRRHKASVYGKGKKRYIYIDLIRFRTNPWSDGWRMWKRGGCVFHSCNVVLLYWKWRVVILYLVYFISYVFLNKHQTCFFGISMKSLQQYHLIEK